MKEKRKIAILLVAVCLVVSYLGYTLLSKERGEAISPENAANQVTKEIEQVKNQEEVYKLVEEEDTDSGYLDEHIESIANNHRDPQHVIKYLLGTMELQDASAFIETFEGQIISNVLFTYENPDKMEVATELMNEISRDGKLSGMRFLSKRGSVGQEITVRVVLEYSDGLEITIPIKMKLYGDAHGEDNRIYYITTSPLEIIEQVKAKEK